MNEIIIDDVSKFRYELVKMIENVKYDSIEYRELSSSQIAEKFENKINSKLSIRKERKIIYHTNDNIRYDNSFDLKGRLHGEQLEYWYNGFLRRKCNYHNGKMHGVDIQFNMHDGKQKHKTKFYISNNEVTKEEWVVIERRINKLNKL